MAYYFLFSLFPFVLFVLALVSMLPIHGLEDWLLETLRQTDPAEAYELLGNIIRGLLAGPRGGLLSLGVLLALWGSSSAMLAVLDGLNRAYRVRDPRPWWRVRLAAIGLTIALSGFMIVAFVLAIFGGVLAEWVARLVPELGLAAPLAVRWGVLTILVFLVVGVLYHSAGRHQRRWRWLTPGAVVFAGGFGGASAVFGEYVGRFGAYDKTYGSLGAVIVLLLWMYLLAFFLLLGGQLNAHLEELTVAQRGLTGPHEP